jgi:cytochrome c oxidase subunit III
METEIKIVEEARKPLAMHPKKFALWLFITSVVMLFMAWTSAYIVKRGEPGWSSFELPAIFWINTAIILVSSVSMVWAVQATRKDNMESAKVALVITLVLGLGFLAGQFLAWGKMVEMNYNFVSSSSNTSGSFIYVVSGAHAAHVIGGLIFILIVLNIGDVLGHKFLAKLVFLRRFIEYVLFVVFIFVALRPNHKLRVNSKQMVALEMCATYWHFMGGLWLYLFVFLLLNR